MSEESTVRTWPELDLPRGLLPNTYLAANALVRCAVFSTLEYAGAAQRPVITEPLPLATMAPYRMTQVAGVRLSQSDANVFFWLLSRAYRGGAPTGNATVFFKCGEALEALGRKRGGKTDVLLDTSLQRLSQADFTCEYLGVVRRTRLLSHVERCENPDKPYDYRITIAASAAELLNDGEWLILPGTVRKQLGSDPLAQGLYAFYASHKSAFPMLTDTLKQLMGRESMQDSKWRQALQKALATVKAVSGWRQCELAQGGRFLGKVVTGRG